MATIEELIEQISESEHDLKQRISREVSLLKQQKKFGMVFEEHLPEATPLIDVPIKKKSIVAEKDGSFNKFYRVKRIEGKTLVCETMDDKHEEVSFEKEEMISVARFGEPIYPYLKPIDEIQNAPDSKLWHTLIEADNYHALQLLVYLYGGKVDCIYIDPPYNTGDKNWKYNNDYVDKFDDFRHSKWLNMMKKRLLLAKKLLNPQDSVLIVTIDEKEYLRLGCLLEELFPEARIQMVSSVISPQGSTREKQFSRTDEYLFIIEFGTASPSKLELSSEWSAGQSVSAGAKKLIWDSLKRRGSNSLRRDRPNLFYPIFVSEDGKRIVNIGESLDININRDSILPIDNTRTIWPIRSNGDEGNWQVSQDQLKDKYEKGFVRLGRFDNRGGMSISYLKRNEQSKVESGIFKVIGNRDDGSIITEDAEQSQKRICGTQWRITTHNAGTYGTALLLKVLGEKRFDFPKSIYAVHDVLRFFTADKPNALIVDFFAGSGTTLHAVNLLNAEDGGNRRCIMVTNNEVSAEEEEKLKRQGFRPGDDEWDKLGIARYVNWPRTKCSIFGIDINGNPLDGSYQTFLKQSVEKQRTIKQITLIAEPQAMTATQKKELVALCFKGKLPQSLVKSGTKYIVSGEHIGSILFDVNYSEEWLEELDGQDQVSEIYIVTRDDKEFTRLKEEVQELLGSIIEEESVVRPMSDGFAANAKYFKLGFLDKNNVELQRQFKELLPLLWMKAGAIGRCPELDNNDIPEMMLLEENSMAILTDEEAYVDFRKCMSGRKDIKSIFIVTNSEDAFMSMAKPFGWAQCYQLYKDYLDNFSINYERR